MVCILLFTLVQYLELRIIPTIIIVSTPLFFLCCHKKFTEPFGNVFFSIEQGITLFLMFLIDGFVLFSFAVTEKNYIRLF